MKQLLKGGTVVSGSGAQRADVLVEGERSWRSPRISPARRQRPSTAPECILFPGFIDAHTHFDLDVCNTTTADDFHAPVVRRPCGAVRRW